MPPVAVTDYSIVKIFLIYFIVSYIAIAYILFLDFSKKSGIFNGKNNLNSSVDFLLPRIAHLAIVSFIFIICLALILFAHMPYEDKGYKINELGDFVGGIVGPLFSFFTFLVVIWTIKIQSDGSKEAQEAQVKLLTIENSRRVEDSFFMLLREFKDSRSLSDIRYISANIAQVHSVLGGNERTRSLIKSRLRFKISAELKIRVSIFARAVELLHKSDIDQLEKVRLVRILRSFMTSEELYAFYYIAYFNITDESDLMQQLQIYLFCPRVVDNPPVWFQDLFTHNFSIKQPNP